jgi:hypothetical protein
MLSQEGKPVEIFSENSKKQDKSGLHMNWNSMLY